MNSVLIIGYGVVGQNIYRKYSALCPDIVDKYKQGVSTKKRERYDFAFVCVDTPYNENGVCDITEVRNAIVENDASIYIIKSTILPKTTDMFVSELSKQIIFSPEYFGGTQHCNNFEFNFTILGGEKSVCLEVVRLLQKVEDGRHQFRIVDAITAELCKYMENSFLATKVSFCVSFYEMCQKLGIHYEELRELFILDPRVGQSHTFVNPDAPYWNSHCLNKDVPAIAEYMDSEFLRGVIEYNKNKKLLTQSI